MELISLPSDWQGESEYFLEGAILASNFALKPLEPEAWCQQAGVDADEASSLLVSQINKQHNLLQRNEYAVSHLQQSQLAEVARGFFSVWPVVEQQYQSVTLNDGSLRMLQALLTTFMLLIDEQQTLSEMEQAGITPLPELSQLLSQIDLMISEVAQSADENMLGGKAQSVNPFKQVGRNDPCPCGSGKKFKRCCAS